MVPRGTDAVPVALGSIREIERELGQLRDASTGPDAAPLLRTSVMTHIARAGALGRAGEHALRPG